MRRFGRLGIVAVVVTIFLTIMPAFSLAVTYAQLYAAKKAERSTQSRLNSTASEMDKTEKQILAYKASINELNSAIATTNGKISNQRVLLNNLQSEERLDEQKQQQLLRQFNAILVNTYESGGYQNYLSVLLSATSWSDFVARLYEIRLILSHNVNIQRQIIQEGRVIKSGELKISQNMATFQDMVGQDNHLVQLKKDSAQKERSTVSMLSATQRRLDEEKAKQLADINNIQRELMAQEEEERLYAKYGPIRGSGGIPVIRQPIHVGDGGISSVIGYAESYLGTPYVWGGTSPHPGFDCSGFTQYVLRHIGVDLERTSQEQYLEGAPVSKSDLEPGDLVFFTTYTSGASHVGIYVGDGLMIDAEDYGVVFDNINNRYWAPRYLGARRIVEP